MIDINIFANMFTEFYFGKWIFMATIFYGICRLTRWIMIGRKN